MKAIINNFTVEEINDVTNLANIFGAAWNAFITPENMYTMQRIYVRDALENALRKIREKERKNNIWVYLSKLNN